MRISQAIVLTAVLCCLGCPAAILDAECPEKCAAGEQCVDGTCARLCNSDNDCDSLYECNDGSCLYVGCLTDADCNDDNPCTSDSCSDTGCVHTANITPCDDSDLCTTNDFCVNGACVGTAVECNDDNGCTQDLCDPATGDCQFPAVAAGTECRAAAGPCDVAEECDSGTCPNDLFASANVCRVAAGPCDIAETCVGNSANCPGDILAGAGIECRASAGQCDVAEVCGGAEITCPADSLALPDVVCRPANGACDTEDLCTGFSATCTGDAVATTAQECRPSTHSCDPAENCDGSTKTCPDDAIRALGYEVCGKYSCSCDSTATTGTVQCCIPIFNTCDDAMTSGLSLLDTHVDGSYNGYLDTWTETAVDSCVPYTTYGDAVSVLEVPAGHLLRLSFYAANNDALVYLVDDCSSASPSCSPIVNAYPSTASTEVLYHFNATGSPETWYTVFDTGSPLVPTSSFTVTAWVAEYNARSGSDTCATTPPVLSTGSYIIELTGHTNALNATTAGTTCAGTGIASTGVDEIYRIVLGDGQFVSTYYFGTGGDPTIYLTTACGNLATCVFRADLAGVDYENFGYSNVTGVAQTYYMVIDSNAGGHVTGGYLDVTIN